MPVALIKVRDEMVRQINDAKTRSEARNNRKLRQRPTELREPGPGTRRHRPSPGRRTVSKAR
jgi:hypothetical protein